MNDASKVSFLLIHPNWSPRWLRLPTIIKCSCLPGVSRQGGFVMQQRDPVEGDFDLRMLQFRVLLRIQRVFSGQLFPKTPSGAGLSQAFYVPIAVPGSDVACQEAVSPLHGPECGMPAAPEGWGFPIRITGQQQVAFPAAV